MAGARGNQASWAFAKQSAKGTPNTTYLNRLPFTEGNIGPSREIDNLSETDANRDQGQAFVQTTGTEGNPGTYVRDVSIHHLLEYALGARAVDDTATPDIVHTVTPANALPYITLYKELGGLLFEQYNDCKVNELTISAEAGQPLTAQLDVAGRAAIRLAAQPASITSLDLDTDTVYNFNDATVTLAGGATSLVGSFELTITNNVTTQQTDDSVPYDVVEGLREVSLGFNLIFETLDEYNKFHYGGAAGTTQSRVLAETDALFNFALGADNSVEFELPHIAYQEFPVEPDAGGDPVVVDVRAVAQRHATDPVVTATVANQEDD
jgi:hypothetical protein